MGRNRNISKLLSHSANSLIMIWRRPAAARGGDDNARPVHDVIPLHNVIRRQAQKLSTKESFVSSSLGGQSKNLEWEIRHDPEEQWNYLAKKLEPFKFGKLCQHRFHVNTQWMAFQYIYDFMCIWKARWKLRLGRSEFKLFRDICDLLWLSGRMQISSQPHSTVATWRWNVIYIDKWSWMWNLFTFSNIIMKHLQGA